MCVCVCVHECVRVHVCECVCVRVRMCVMSSKLKMIKFNEKDDLMSTSGLRTLIAIIREYLKWGSRDSIFSPLSGLLPLRSCVLWVHRVKQGKTDCDLAHCLLGWASRVAQW